MPIGCVALIERGDERKGRISQTKNFGQLNVASWDVYQYQSGRDKEGVRQHDKTDMITQRAALQQSIAKKENPQKKYLERFARTGVRNQESYDSGVISVNFCEVCK